MIQRATVVLSLSLGLLISQAAQGQTVAEDPAVPPEEEQASPETPPYPAPEVAPAEEASPPPAAASPKATDSAGRTDGKREQSKADKDRCAQLLAQGQIALAQAAGCGGGDQPIWAGTTVSFTQTTAPASRTLPDSKNPFYAMGLTLAPRLTLTENWALNGDVTFAYEVTKPDSLGNDEVLASDTRLTASGNLGTIGGFTFTGGPRLVLPTSKASWAADVYLGAGAVMNIIRSFDVLSGLAFIAGGSYGHTWSGNLTRERENRDACTGTRNDTTACAASGARVVQDTFRAVAASSLNVTPEVNFQLSYVYGWGLVKPFADDTPTVSVDNGPDLAVSSNVLPDTRWSRFGSLSLSASYQPVSWLIGSLQANTSVCYNSDSGGQSALSGGCAGGLRASSFALRNPIANKFSTVSLQFTIPVDALYDVIRRGGSREKQVASGIRAARL